MNGNGGNDAKIDWVVTQPTPSQDENVGKIYQTWNFGKVIQIANDPLCKE